MNSVSLSEYLCAIDKPRLLLLVVHSLGLAVPTSEIRKPFCHLADPQSCLPCQLFPLYLAGIGAGFIAGKPVFQNGLTVLRKDDPLAFYHHFWCLLAR